MFSTSWKLVHFVCQMELFLHFLCRICSTSYTSKQTLRRKCKRWWNRENQQNSSGNNLTVGFLLVSIPENCNMCFTCSGNNWQLQTIQADWPHEIFIFFLCSKGSIRHLQWHSRINLLLKKYLPPKPKRHHKLVFNAMLKQDQLKETLPGLYLNCCSEMCSYQLTKVPAALSTLTTGAQEFQVVNWTEVIQKMAWEIHFLFPYPKTINWIQLEWGPTFSMWLIFQAFGKHRPLHWFGIWLQLHQQISRNLFLIAGLR